MFIPARGSCTRRELALVLWAVATSAQDMDRDNFAAIGSALLKRMQGSPGPSGACLCMRTPARMCVPASVGAWVCACARVCLPACVGACLHVCGCAPGYVGTRLRVKVDACKCGPVCEGQCLQVWEGQRLQLWACV